MRLPATRQPCSASSTSGNSTGVRIRRSGASRSASIICSTPTARCSRRSTRQTSHRPPARSGSGCPAAAPVRTRHGPIADAGRERKFTAPASAAPAASAIEPDITDRFIAHQREAAAHVRTFEDRDAGPHHGVAVRLVHHLQRARRLPADRHARATPLRAGPARHSGAGIPVPQRGVEFSVTRHDPRGTTLGAAIID